MFVIHGNKTASHHRIDTTRAFPEFTSMALTDEGISDDAKADVKETLLSTLTS
ncbi:hypothetical protein OH492_08590 [Vibrio chagasii]|nr:hypothetical protein [Vibrio chagasii]